MSGGPSRNVADGDRDGDRLADESDISESGYPEEQPGGDAGKAEDKSPREGAKVPRKHDDLADETDHGKATGNPRSAG